MVRHRATGVQSYENNMAAPEEAATAIFRAAQAGDAAEVATLLEARPDLLEAIDPFTRYPLLYAASRGGRADVVRLLLAKGANISCENEWGWTPICGAACYGHTEVVALLLRAGANIRQRGDENTSLMAACINGHLGVTRVLLQHMGGEGLNARGVKGRTALCWAAVRRRVDICRALLLAGADHTIADDQGQTPREEAQLSEGNPCVPVFEWWEDELERGYALHRARRVHEDSTSRQQAPGAPVPAYLRRRVQAEKRLPHVQLQGGRVTRASARRVREESGGEPSEEEKGAMVKYVVADLAPELYIELMAAFHN